MWPFANAVKAKAASFMCSYQRINGSYGKMDEGFREVIANFPTQVAKTLCLRMVSSKLNSVSKGKARTLIHS